MCKIIDQLAVSIESRNVNQVFVALRIAKSQKPPIDLNAILSNGHTILSFAVLHFHPVILSMLANEPSINFGEPNAFNKTIVDVANDHQISIDLLRFAIGDDRLPTLATEMKPPDFSVVDGTEVVTDKENNPVMDMVDQQPSSSNAIASEDINDVALSKTECNKKPRRTNTQHICNECGRHYGSSTSLRAHRLIHTGVKPYKCDLCTYRATTKGNVAQHRRTHTGEHPFKCSECARTFAQSSHLRAHIRLHTREKPFKCMECDYEGTQLANLNEHRLRYHTVDDVKKMDLENNDNADEFVDVKPQSIPFEIVF